MDTNSAGQVWPPVAPLTGQPAHVEPGQRLNIRQCPSCDGSHDDLQVREYSKPQGPFTHWFTCPNSKDPVSLSLLMLTSGEGMELNGAVCQALAEAQLAGRWMIAVFTITPDGKLLCRRSTAKFPTGDYDICMNLFRENLQQETGPAQPAKMADGRPNPLRSLLGAFDPNAKQQQIKLPSHPVAEQPSLDMGVQMVPPEMAPAETSADKLGSVG